MSLLIAASPYDTAPRPNPPGPPARRARRPGLARAAVSDVLAVGDAVRWDTRRPMGTTSEGAAPPRTVTCASTPWCGLRTRVASFLAAVMIGGTLAGRPAVAQVRPGTYALALCRAAPCAPDDTAAAYLTATVVLLDSVAATARALPRPAWELAPANGCFAVRYRRRPQPESYAGLQGVGSLRWGPAPGPVGRIAFALYRSPDAGYTVRLVPVADGLAGSGRSYGAGAAEIVAPSDTVVATRVATPTRRAARTRGSRHRVRRRDRRRAPTRRS